MRITTRPLTREQQIDLIVNSGGAIFQGMRLSPDLGMVRRFLEAQPETEVERWFRLILNGRAS